MILKIIEDSIKRTDLFTWFGKIDQANLRLWLNQKKICIPEDLFEFLCETGGGDIFESETILGPNGNIEVGDDIENMNIFHWDKGLPKRYIIFHIGALGISVIDRNSQHYIVLDKYYSLIRSFNDFYEWYCNYIRVEFADRYGLH